MCNPFVYSDSDRRYFTLDSFYRKKFGCKCFKVPLDGGFTCPTLNGEKGFAGCTYCSLKNNGHNAKPLREQFEINRKILHRKWKNALYIAYFNIFTGTYGSVPKLRALYEEALSFDGVVGLNIATRADALPDEVVILLHEIAVRTHLTVELGLQSVHDITAQRINRGHTYSEFLEGYEKLRGLNVCIHIINGLPGESFDMMQETARSVAFLHPQSVKLHVLNILRGTQMAHEYEQCPFGIPDPDEYAGIVVSQLEWMPPDTVIARISGDGNTAELIAPLWCRDKLKLLNKIDAEFVRRNSWQGKLYNG